MNKPQKDRLGSLDFNVQNSFALGGPAFGVHEARVQAQAAQDAHAGYVAATLDPAASARHQGLLDTDQAQSRGSRASGAGSRRQRLQPKSVTTRAGPKHLQTLQTSLIEGELPKVSETPFSATNAGALPTAFGSYISKVINSVQHRKRNPRLKSLFNQGSYEH